MNVAKKASAKPSKNGSRSKDLKGGCSGENPHTPLIEAAAKLAAAKKPPELRLPPKNRTDMTVFEYLRVQVEEAEVRDGDIAELVGDWMEKDSLPNLDKIDAQVVRLGDRVLQLIAGKDEEGEDITFARQRDEYKRLNADYLAAGFTIGESENGEPFLLPALKTRQAAHMAVIKHRFSSEVDRGNLIDTVNLCVQDGYFTEHNDGPIVVWQRRFFLSDDEKFGKMDEEQERLLAAIIGHHVSRINGLYQDDVRAKADELKKMSELSIRQLLDGHAGKCFVHLLVEKRGNFRFSEVCLLLEGDGKGKVFVLDAVGPDAKKAQEIRDTKIHLNIQHMGIPRPPRIETMMERWGFSEENAVRYQHLWGYLDRAKRAEEEKDSRERDKEIVAKAREEEQALFDRAVQEASALKEEYADEATLSLDRVFLEIEPMEGVFFGEFHGDWRNPDGSIIPNGLLFFLAEQKIVDGMPQMKIRRAPDHLVGKFFKDEHMVFTPCEELFRGLGQPMQGLMKSLHRQTRNQAEIA